MQSIRSEVERYMDVLRPQTSWSEGSYILESMLTGTATPDIKASESIRQEFTRITPLGLSVHLDQNASRHSTDHVVKNLLKELKNSLDYWQHRPLGDIYWNRCIVEQLDEGCLTELMFNLSSTLLNKDHQYRHLAELSVLKEGLGKLELLRGLGVTKVVFSLPLWPISNPQLPTTLSNACRLAKDLGCQVCIRLTYNIEQTSFEDLVRLFLDLPECGRHELILAPVIVKRGRAISCWHSNLLSQKTLSVMASSRKWLLSQGYRPKGFDCYLLSQPTESTRQMFFDLTGQLATCSPEFVGIGPGATSRLGNFYTKNHADYLRYSEALSKDRYPRKSIEHLANNYLVLEKSIAELLNHLSLDLAKTAKKIAIPRDEYIIQTENLLAHLPKTAWSIDKNARLVVSDDGRDWLPWVCSVLTNERVFV